LMRCSSTSFESIGSFVNRWVIYFYVETLVLEKLC
jgi:hypothetical protein